MAVKAASVRAIICTLCKYMSQIPFSCVRTNIYLSRHNSLLMCLNFQRSCFFVSVSQHLLSSRPPKKPPGAFITFLNDKLAEIRNKIPGACITERSKMASDMWHNLDPEERNKRKLEAMQELRSYRKKYIIFLHGLSDTERIQLLQEKAAKIKSRVIRRRKMELRIFGKPKKPVNAFILFVRSSRQERGNLHIHEFIKDRVECWKQMPQEEKAIYVEDAKLDAERYKQEKKEWEERMREIGREDLIRTKAQKTKKEPQGETTSKSNEI